MGFSYSAAELTTPLNHLRFLVQDTTDAGHILDDAELTFALDQETNIYRAAAGLCRAIAARFARMPSQEDGTVTFDSRKAAEHYMALAKTYDAKADAADSSLTNPENQGMSFPTIGNGNENLPAFTRSLHLS